MNEFAITQKHYNIIIKQGYDNLPYETGGFLGGNEDGTITAILPSFNQHDDGRKDNFVFTSDMLVRAHKFFKKHNLKYFGLYHTHPTGEPFPSDADIKSGQRYHFIISYKYQDSPILNAFIVLNNKAVQVPIKILNDKEFSSKENKQSEAKIKRFSPQQTPNEDRADLEERIGNIITEQPNKYERIEPRTDVNGSDFSTMA